MENKRGVFAEPEKSTVQGITLPEGSDKAMVEASTAVMSFIQQVGQIVIQNTDDLIRINENQERARKGMKFIDNLFANALTKAQSAKAAAEASRKALTDLIEEVKKPLTQYQIEAVVKIKAYNKAEEDRKTEIALVKEKERLEAAAKLEQAGDKVGAELIIDLGKGEIEDAKKPDIKLDQRIFGKKYKARVVDMVLLCGAIADRKVMPFAVIANQTWLNDQAKLNKGQNSPPGVEFFEE